MTERERLIDLLREPLPVIRGYDTIGETRMSIVDAEKIADRLLANGVIVPPVTVGQTVWVIVGRMLPHIAECEVIAVAQHYISLDNKRKVFTFSVVAKNSTTNATFFESDIGKRVFFDKEHAEKTLAERGNHG